MSFRPCGASWRLPAERWKTNAYFSEAQHRWSFVVSPLLNVRCSVHHSIYGHLPHQDELLCLYCQYKAYLFGHQWYQVSAFLQKFSVLSHFLTTCWISYKLCATFHISLAVPSICSRFLSCKVMHTKIDNLKSLVAFGVSASSARFFDIVF